MGIEYSAKLLVGLPAEDLEDFLGEDVAETCWNKGLVYASPYYDSGSDVWVVGVDVASSGDFDWVNVDIDQIDIAKARFLQITKKHGQLILSTHGS